MLLGRRKLRGSDRSEVTLGGVALFDFAQGRLSSAAINCARENGFAAEVLYRAKQNAPDSFESGAYVDQPSPKCCSIRRLNPSCTSVNG